MKKKVIVGLLILVMSGFWSVGVRADMGKVSESIGYFKQGIKQHS